MTAEEEKQRLEEDLDEARRGLHATAEQMRQKVEEVELNPERAIVGRYPAAAIGVTAALGFLAGTTVDEVFEPIVFGLLLGFGVSKLTAPRGNGSDGG
jgi:ElaB/YqjD/DUF883 family membrane-anchored ribosome-binding protein